MRFNGCKLKPFTFLGSSFRADGDGMKLHSDTWIENADKLDVNSGSLYLFYPVRKQGLALAMGANKAERVADFSNNKAGAIPQVEGFDAFV